jgi:hypothetical protein
MIKRSKVVIVKASGRMPAALCVREGIQKSRMRLTPRLIGVLMRGGSKLVNPAPSISHPFAKLN